jgi:tRNA-splicing ligase RtcB
MELIRLDEYRWLIPKHGKMRVDGLVFADAGLMQSIRGDEALQQVANVAQLPGIVGRSIGMPDIHWGYGFAIGGVAAFDPERGGVISPGGVGYDINCLSGDARILHAHGYTRTIADVVQGSAAADVAVLDIEKHALGEGTVIAARGQRPPRRIFELETRSGRRIRATEDHPFLTPAGMREMGTLGIGDAVAVLSFEGVLYEPPDDSVLVDEADILRVALREGRTNAGNGFPQALAHLRPLLPLTYDHPALPVLAKVFGYVLGDGTAYWERGRMKGRVVAYGARADLDAMAADLSPWFTPSRVRSRHRRHRVPTGYGTFDTEATEHSLRIGSTALLLLLGALGMPIGPKAKQDWSLPGWVESAPLWIQRLFVAGYFGAELSKPAAFVERAKNFNCPVLVVQKREGFEETGRAFLRQLAAVLDRFGVRTLAVSRKAAQTNADGGRSVRLRLVLSSDLDSLIALWTRIGFEYNRARSATSQIAAAYLLWKRAELERRAALLERIRVLRTATGWGAVRIRGALTAAAAPAVNLRFVERTLHGGGERTVRSAPDFSGFHDWAADATLGLEGSGCVWEPIEALRPVSDVSHVYDLSVDHRDHNFIANGFVVHNCGVRLLRSNLTREELRPRLRTLMDRLFETIPAGVGKGYEKFVLAPRELGRVLTRGAAWAVEKGLGVPGDLGHIEDGGTISGADPDQVSARAVQRGADQVGTVGSGNHFIEVGWVDQVYDERVASRLGLEMGTVTTFIHSGSRGLGYQVCDDYLGVMLEASARYDIDLPDRQLCCAPLESPEAERYLGAMRAAANFAFANRQVMAHRVREAFAHVFGRPWDALGMGLVYDVAHNIAKFEKHQVGGVERTLCVHRKGATRAFPPGHPELGDAYRDLGQPVLIPGDMGRYSYVLVGTPGAFQETFGSTCHGAGRRMSRREAKRSARGRNLREAFDQAGVEVRASSFATVAEEIPEAYKDVADVVGVVDGAGIGRKVVRLRPLGVLKG